MQMVGKSHSTSYSETCIDHHSRRSASVVRLLKSDGFPAGNIVDISMFCPDPHINLFASSSFIVEAIPAIVGGAAPMAHMQEEASNGHHHRRRYAPSVVRSKEPPLDNLVFATSSRSVCAC